MVHTLLWSSFEIPGWFKFESDSDGVQRLDRQWVPLHDLEQAEGWKAAVLKLEEKLKKASSDLAAGGSPRSTESWVSLYRGTS